MLLPRGGKDDAKVTQQKSVSRFSGSTAASGGGGGGGSRSVRATKGKQGEDPEGQLRVRVCRRETRGGKKRRWREKEQETRERGGEEEA